MRHTFSVIFYFSAFIFGACMFALACIADYIVVKKPNPVSALSISGKIPFRYTLCVLCGGIISTCCVNLFGATPDGILRFLFIAVLAAVALIDRDTMEIPDVLSVIIGFLGVISCFVFKEVSLLSHLIGIVSVSVPLILITLLVPGAFGGGDIKLMAACGLLLGWRDALLSAFIAVLIGGGWGAYLLISKKKGGKEHFAFGPFLCLGMTLCALMGHKIAELFLYLFDISRLF